MLRLISALLFIIGLAAVGFGIWSYMGREEPAGMDAAPLPPPVERSVSAVPELPPVTMSEEFVGPESVGPARTTDDIVENLEDVPIAYEAPETARLDKTFQLTLAVDATGQDAAVEALPGRGSVTEGDARVSGRILARLTGAGYEIEALGIETQTLSPLEVNTWRWAVKPIESGEQDLTVEIFALIGEEALPVRTFRNTVTVEVSAVQQVIKVAASANPLFVILGGLGSLIAGFAGLARLFRGA